MYKYTHVDAFYQVARYVKKVNESFAVPDCYKIKGPVEFRGTTKLHGTNAGVTQEPNGEIYAQSRTRKITPEDDNHGFAKFVEKNRDYIVGLMNRVRGKKGIGSNSYLTIYGEWIGKGINNGVAINSLQNQWVIFAAKTSDDGNTENAKYIDVLPYLDIKHDFLNQEIFSIWQAPVHFLTVDFSSDESKKEAIKKFEELTEEVEKECPWAKLFGFSGTGEGIVWEPIGKHYGNSDLYFKTKGDKHKVVKSKKKEQLEPEVLNSINEFIEFSCTENRLNQGIEALKEAGHEVAPKSTGYYLKWVGNDVQRECRLELEDNKLEWKQVAKKVNEKARKFFLERMKEI